MLIAKAHQLLGEGFGVWLDGMGSTLGVYSVSGPQKAVQYLACGPWTVAMDSGPNAGNMAAFESRKFSAGTSRQAWLWKNKVPLRNGRTLSSCRSCCHACLFLLPILPKCSDERKGSRYLMGCCSVSYNSGLQFWGKNFRMKTKRNFLKSCQNI